MADNLTLAMIYIYVVGAMISSSVLATILALDTRLQQVGLAMALGVFWTAYYVWAVHPKLLERADLESLEDAAGAE